MPQLIVVAGISASRDQDLAKVGNQQVIFNMKLHVEYNSKPSIVAIIVALCVGGLFALTKDLCIGIIIFYMVFAIVQTLSDWISTPPLPADAKSCAQVALDLFRDQFPDARIENVAVRDVSVERLIISITAQIPGSFTIPTNRTYYAVRRSDKIATMEERSKWWPRGLK